MSLRKRPRITAKMLAANRLNSMKSTGPRTTEGKSRVRFNALRHGQRARSCREAIAALGGDPAELDFIMRVCYARPDSAKEQRQVERMAYEDWLLRGDSKKRIIFSTDQTRNLL